MVVGQRAAETAKEVKIATIQAATANMLETAQVLVKQNTYHSNRHGRPKPDCFYLTTGVTMSLPRIHAGLIG
jgi:hypothetical protein